MGGGGGVNYLCAQIDLRFRHAHHETKDWLQSLGSQGGILQLFTNIYLCTELTLSAQSQNTENAIKETSGELANS